MDKNIASAMLLRLNKQDQIEALKSIGFTTVNENTPRKRHRQIYAMVRYAS